MMTALALSVMLTLSQTPAEPPEASRASAPEAPAGKPVLSRVTLRDGQVLRGTVVTRDAQHLVLELGGGSRMDLPVELVEKVEEEPSAYVRDSGEIWLTDPNRTRYLYAPSALMLRQGEGYFSQKELLFSSINYGLTDHITLQAGSVLPLWFVEGGANFIGGVKVGGSPTERIHLAAGAQGLVIPGFGSDLGVVGFLFGTGTYGTPNAHVSLGLGKPFQLNNTGGRLPSDFIVTLSGNLRVAERVALVTENWVLPTLSSPDASGLPPMLNSLAVRLFGEHWAVDLGLIRVPSVPVPVPWLDFSYNFGG